MNIYLTYDYELFFGERTGSVDKCMIEPTNFLLDAAKEKAKLTFFVDVGYLIALDKWKANFPVLVRDLEKIKLQIDRMISEEHAVQLHIHPHWEKAEFDGGKWLINAKGCYKLSDFSKEEAAQIVRKYKSFLDEFTGQQSTVFRAGGWCIQPFSQLAEVFEDLGLSIDSSVMPGMAYATEHYAYDFSQIESAVPYRFGNDVCLADENGFMMEFPIATMQYSPLFYWRLYVLGRLFPARHKAIGDGTAIAQPGRKKEILTRKSLHHVSTDGYFATKIDSATKMFEKQGMQHLVIIGHPKSMTKYSMPLIKKYIDRYYQRFSFVSLVHANH